MPRQKRRIWTHMFCALAGMHCPIVPSQPELIALQQCGLGLRDITFDFDGDAVNVQTTICRFIILDCKLFCISSLLSRLRATPTSVLLSITN